MSVSDLWKKYAPRIAQAKKRDAESRFEAFIDADSEMIGEFEVVPLTLSKYALLSVKDFWKGTSEKMPILRFLWVMSPQYNDSVHDAKKFIDENWQCDFSGYQKEITEYINRYFLFAPPANSKTKSGASEWISSIVDTFASQYAWSEKEILNIRLDRLFLYLQRIRQRNAKNPITFSTEADRLKQEFMDEVNNQRISRN